MRLFAYKKEDLKKSSTFFKYLRASCLEDRDGLSFVFSALQRGTSRIYREADFSSAEGIPF